MTDTQNAGAGYRAPETVPEPTGWVGWVLFAGVMLFIVGAFQGIAGLVALFNDDYYAVGVRDMVIEINYTAWGVIHLGLAALAFVAGYAVSTKGSVWARGLGITLAFLNAVANLAFMPAYPVWCTIVIALDILVIYALTVHGREVTYLR